jgi:hypothetical protein
VFAESGDQLEACFTRASLPLSSSLTTYAAWMLYEGAGFESSFLPMPESAFAGGTYDPDIAAGWALDLAIDPSHPSARRLLP